jgi:hypothetical protein
MSSSSLEKPIKSLDDASCMNSKSDQSMGTMRCCHESRIPETHSHPSMSAYIDSNNDQVIRLIRGAP